MSITNNTLSSSFFYKELPDDLEEKTIVISRRKKLVNKSAASPQKKQKDIWVDRQIYSFQLHNKSEGDKEKNKNRKFSVSQPKEFFPEKISPKNESSTLKQELKTHKTVFQFFEPSKQSTNEQLSQRNKSSSNSSLSSLFIDEEIRKVSTHIQEVKFTKQFCFTAYLSENRKTVIQQFLNDEWGTAAAIAMLAMDNYKRPHTHFFFKKDLFTNVKDRTAEFKKAGLTTIVSSLSSVDPLQKLREYVEKNGSAMVDIQRFENQRGVVIVDEIYESLSWARIRDPYHGWEIEVSGPALSCRIIIPQQIIQVVSNS